MVSIIVPMYNCEKYIKECIVSIERQLYKDLEIIIINDGSYDKSKEICEQLCQIYSNIRLINIPNGGVSKARNTGIAYAKGEYIQFVDADDTVDKHYTGKMLEILLNNNVDWVISGYSEVFDNFENIVTYDGKLFGYKDVDYIELLKTNKLINSPCNKIYKRELITFPFPENLDLGEDLIFNLEYSIKCKSMMFCNKSLYNYITHSNSLTTKYTRKKMMDIIKLDQLCSADYDLGSVYLHNFISNMYDLFCVFSKEKLITKSDKKLFWTELLDNQYIVERFSGTKSQLGLKETLWIQLIKYKRKFPLVLFSKIILYKYYFSRMLKK